MADDAVARIASNQHEHSPRDGSASSCSSCSSLSTALQEATDQQETLTKALCASEAFRKRYRDGKLELYALGGEIQEAAMQHLPCSEGPLESWVRWHVLLPQHRMVVDDLHVTALALQAVEQQLTAVREQVREAFMAGFNAHPGQNKDEPRRWAFDPYIAADTEASAWDAWQVLKLTPPAVVERSPQEQNETDQTRVAGPCTGSPVLPQQAEE